MWDEQLKQLQAHGLNIALAIVVILLLWVQVHLWFGKGSYREYAQLQERITAQKQENVQLKIRNESLAAEVNDLKNGSEAIEERARAELGMIKQGEVFFQIVK
ncbi:septum formation initiator [Beggiatoa alba B18LD]|uniref:Cell division protein FtsB n=1 Tax=Beggiatoa alba B18LD TaxID=395493 RepID=I3CJQ0_9GAMM|nr:cell division protein FtsB [Beggiatoa alba]EIJ43843.1 septum formation initiator [Beggiatoa alba B18LD]